MKQISEIRNKHWIRLFGFTLDGRLYTGRRG